MKVKNKKISLNDKQKKELVKELNNLVKKNETVIKKNLEDLGFDASKIVIIDRAKFMVKYIPDAMEELIKKYGATKVLTDKNKIMKEGFELVQKKFHKQLANQKIKKWNIYYILKNCKIPKKISLDKNITLISFGGEPGNDYNEIIDKLIFKIGPQASRISEEIHNEGKELFKKVYSEKNPLSLLIFENLQAKSEKEVFEDTKGFVNNVILGMSVMTNSCIELGGILAVGKINGFSLIYPTLPFTYYNMPYLEKDSLEIVTKKILENIDKKHLLKLALKYEKEALSEDEDEFRILKRWAIIEYIAEEFSMTKEKTDKILSKKEKQEIQKFITLKINKDIYSKNPKLVERVKSCIGQINHKNAKEKVRDLLNYSGFKLVKINPSGKDIVDIIYQFRNCITHFGGCYKNEENDIDKCEGPKYCNQSELNLKDINLELSHMIKQIIGTFINVEFGYQEDVPKKIKTEYGEN